MKPILQIFPMMLLLLLGLGLGHWLTPEVGDDSQEMLNQLWDSDSWEETVEDREVAKAMKHQEAGNNNVLMLDSMESSLAEALLQEDEVLGEEDSEVKDFSHKDDVSYLRQDRFNRDWNVAMAQKARQSKSICKVKHTFIEAKLDKVKAVCNTQSIPFKENKCYQSSEPMKFTVCQLIGDIVIPNKCYYRSTPMIVTITIDCKGMGPKSFHY